MALILLILHSFVRWLVLLVGVIALVKFVIGWLRGSTFEAIDQRLRSMFIGSMDLQAAIGLILLLWTGLIDGVGFPGNRLAHTGVMILAVALGHMSARWKNAEDTVRFRNNFVVILGVFVLVFIGIALV